MKNVGIFNHVLGPIMRGPSSSHTAGSHHIGLMARSLLGGTPRRAMLTFDPQGSFAVTYRPQGADRGFAMGLMGKPLTDASFFSALRDGPAAGMDLQYDVRPLIGADHPNTVELDLTSNDGKALRLMARSIGGGEVEITKVDNRPVLFNGSAYEVLLDVDADRVRAACDLLTADGQLLDDPVESSEDGRARLTARRGASLRDTARCRLNSLDASARLWQSAPVYFVQRGRALFGSAEEMTRIAAQRKLSLGRTALAYEAELLGITESEVVAEMLRRYDVMTRAVAEGLDLEFRGLQLLPACAGAVYRAEAEGRLATRSMHTRAAARAMAVMHVDGAMGVICAAPTGGSAGVIPGALVTLAEERSLARERTALALLAAGAIGVIIAQRATFAAEVAGCQVEIGASGAMAAAAIVDAVGGTARQACDAAAISLQNTMGSVCDLLHGMVEIPCHTRNAAAAASALVNADLILGGYQNLIPLDETIDAMYSVGLAMPMELRCTSLGGLATTPSARTLTRNGPSSECSKCR